MSILVSLNNPVFGCVGGLPRSLAELEGQDYTELPADICQGYADMLFGQTGNDEYGGIICDRTEGSYLLLQRLVGYTEQRKAIWSIIRIHWLANLKNEETAISAGCEHQYNSATPVVALVKPKTQASFTILKAWAVDLKQERLHSISTQSVVCQTPFLDQHL